MAVLTLWVVAQLSHPCEFHTASLSLSLASSVTILQVVYSCLVPQAFALLCICILESCLVIAIQNPSALFKSSVLFLPGESLTLLCYYGVLLTGQRITFLCTLQTVK